MIITYGNIISVKDYNCLRKAVGWNELEVEQAERGLQNSSYITVAYKEAQVVGTARVIGDGGYIAIIVDVIVLPEFQGNGIGSQLMNNVINYLENSITETQCLMINLMAAPNKESFYNKFKFVERPNESMGAGMVRWLNR